MIKVLLRYSGLNFLTHLYTSIASKRNVIIRIPDISLPLSNSWKLELWSLKRNRNALVWMSSVAVKDFFGQEHPKDWAIIQIWHYEGFINGQSTIVVQGAFWYLQYVQRTTGLRTQVCYNFVVLKTVVDGDSKHRHVIRSLNFHIINYKFCIWLTIEWTVIYSHLPNELSLHH